MNESKRGELILALFFLGFFVVLTLLSMNYSPNARRVPLIVTIPGIALSAVQTFKAIGHLRKTRKASSPEAGSAGNAAMDEKKKVLLMVGWLLLLVGMIWIFGFLITIPVYTVLFMKSLKESWRVSIIFAVSGFVVLYFLFVVGLHMDLYRGLLFEP